MNLEKEGLNFIKKKYSLQNKPEGVSANRRLEKRTNEKQSSKSEDKIKNYFDRFKEILNREDNKERIRGINAFKKVLFEKNIIKPKEIPERVYELEQEIAFDQGHGYIEITDHFKKEKQKEIVNKQKESLSQWINYLSSNDAMYPIWAKYWVLNSILKLGNFDKEKKIFKKRGKQSVAPFPSMNPMAIAKSIKFIQQKNNNEEIENFSNLNDKEFKKILSKEDFGKYYALVLNSMPEFSEKGLENIKGEWVKYNQGDNAQRLYDSLQGYPMEWCTQGSIDMAQNQLNGGDFYVYYSENTKGENKIPRVAIRMENNNIAEVRGIEKGQNLDNFIVPVVEEKMSKFGNEGQRYKEKVKDMKLLTEIYRKFEKDENREIVNGNNIDLNIEELKFIYEIDDNIKGFGYDSVDPRINNIINSRDIKVDLQLIVNSKNDKDLVKFLIENDKKYFLSDRRIEWNLSIEDLEFLKNNILDDKEDKKNFYNQIIIEKIKSNIELDNEQKIYLYRNIFKIYLDNEHGNLEFDGHIKGIFSESDIGSSYFDKDEFKEFSKKDLSIAMSFLSKDILSIKDSSNKVSVEWEELVNYFLPLVEEYEFNIDFIEKLSDIQNCYEIFKNNNKNELDLISKKVQEYFLSKNELINKDLIVFLDIMKKNNFDSKIIEKINKHFNFDKNINKYINTTFPYMDSIYNLSEKDLNGFIENGLIEERPQLVDKEENGKNEFNEDEDIDPIEYDIDRIMENNKHLSKQDYEYLWEKEFKKESIKEEKKKSKYWLVKPYVEEKVDEFDGYTEKFFVDGDELENLFITLKFLSKGDYDAEKINRKDLEKKILDDLSENNILNYALRDRNLFSNENIPLIYYAKKQNFDFFNDSYGDDLKNKHKIEKELFSNLNEEKIDILIEYGFFDVLMDNISSFSKIAYIEDNYSDKFKEYIANYYYSVWTFENKEHQNNLVLEEYIWKSKGIDYFLSDNKRQEYLEYSLLSNKFINDSFIENEFIELIERSNKKPSSEDINRFIWSSTWKIKKVFKSKFADFLINNYPNGKDIVINRLGHFGELNQNIFNILFNNNKDKNKIYENIDSFKDIEISNEILEDIINYYPTRNSTYKLIELIAEYNNMNKNNFLNFIKKMRIEDNELSLLVMKNNLSKFFKNFSKFMNDENMDDSDNWIGNSVFSIISKEYWKRKEE